MNEALDLAAVTADPAEDLVRRATSRWSPDIVMMVAEDLAEALDIVPDERVLDVACGSGNGAIAAARRAWGNTVGADFVPSLLERGRERARPSGSRSSSSRPTPQDLPFEDGELRRRDVDLRRDVRARPGEGGAELLRVCKPGGRIGMANWVPDGGIGTDVHDDRQARAAAARRSTRRCSGGPRSACASCSATGSPTCGSSAESRASRSAPPTTTSSSSAPTSARPRSPSSGSARRVRRR